MRILTIRYYYYYVENTAATAQTETIALFGGCISTKEGSLLNFHPLIRGMFCLSRGCTREPYPVT